MVIMIVIMVLVMMVTPALLSAREVVQRFYTVARGHSWSAAACTETAVTKIMMIMVVVVVVVMMMKMTIVGDAK